MPTCQYCIRHVTYYDAKLFEFWPVVSDVGPAIKQHWVNGLCLLGSAPVINSRPNTPTLTKCWASVVGGVPALKQRWPHVICPAVCVFACMVSLSQRHVHNNTQMTQGYVESTFVHHLRRRTNVKPTLIQRFVHTHVWGPV